MESPDLQKVQRTGSFSKPNNHGSLLDSPRKYHLPSSSANWGLGQGLTVKEWSENRAAQLDAERAGCSISISPRWTSWPQEPKKISKPSGRASSRCGLTWTKTTS